MNYEFLKRQYVERAGRGIKLPDISNLVGFNPNDITNEHELNVAKITWAIPGVVVSMIEQNIRNEQDYSSRYVFGWRLLMRLSNPVLFR